jgi:Metallo-peptidase family M12/Secretion system C-terminal sorting domain
MKKVYLIFFAICFVSSAFAQNLSPVAEKVQQMKNGNDEFKKVNLFEVLKSDSKLEDVKRVATDALVLSIDISELTKTAEKSDEAIEFSIPLNDEVLELELVKVNLFTPDFIVNTSSGKSFDGNIGVHYQGIVKGKSNSLAAISIFNNEVMGLISLKDNGNIVLGKIENDANNKYVVYNDKTFVSTLNSSCATPDDNHIYTEEELAKPEIEKSAGDCIRLYWEADYDIFVNKGGTANTVAYLTGLFNQSNVIYAADGIPLVLSEVFVWESQDPYNGGGSFEQLALFQANRNSFNGDLGHLLDFNPYGGVAAGFSGFCAANLDDSQCYSGIEPTYNDVPTYSWSVFLVSHEQGHLLGSRHTHACVWNGNGTAIDGCAGFVEGSCALPPNPAGGGTIMSYCYFVSEGVNLSLGFGPQPQSVILNNYNNATCLSACNGPICPDVYEPNNDLSLSTYIASGSLNATIGEFGDNDFYYTYIGSTSNISLTLSNLPANYDIYLYDQNITYLAGSASGGTANEVINYFNAPAGYYYIQVIAGNGESDNSICYNLNTSVTPVSPDCPDYYESNNDFSTAYGIGAGTISASIAPQYDNDYFYIYVGANSDLSFNLANLPGDYDIQIFDQFGNYLTGGFNGGSNAENVYLANATPGYYYIYIYGYAGAFSTTQCYQLTTTISTIVVACPDYNEPNNDFYSATYLYEYSGDEGNIDSYYESDYFAVYPYYSGDVYVYLFNLPADYDLQLFDSYGNLVSTSNTSGNGDEYVYYPYAYDYVYYARVYSSYGDYNASQCYSVFNYSTYYDWGGGYAPNVNQEEIVDGQDQTVRVFPNPAYDNVNVNIPAFDLGNTEVVIFDQLGNQVFQKTIGASKTSSIQMFDISNFANGMYLMQIVQDKRIVNQKINVLR